MQYKFLQYIRIFGVTLCISLVAVGTLNWVIDPYDELGRNWIGVYTNDDRQRIRKIEDFPHDAILIGSSRPSHIDPSHLCGYKFYNASFGAALPEEIYYYLKKNIKDEKFVAIGIDFYMFNENAYPLISIDKWPDHYWPRHEYLLGWNVLIASIMAIYSKFYFRHIPPSNGFVPLSNNATPDMQDYAKGINIFMNIYKNYPALSEARLEHIRKMKQLLDARHIKYIFFINPMQVDHWKVLHLTGSYKTYLELVDRLLQIIPDLKYFSEGQYSQRELYKSTDPSHYLPVVGEEFMNDLLGCAEQ